MALMISVSGIRGIFGEDLNPENLARFTAAYGTWIGGGTVVVGRDSRVTGELCEKIVAATLQSTGCDVILAGIVPTPTVAMEVLRHGARGGIMLSASHNPAEWNALKLLNEKSEFLDATQGEQVIAIAESGKMAYVGYDQIGSVSVSDDAVKDHVDKILALPYIHAGQIAAANFSVAVDAVNGAGSESFPYLLERLGIKRIEKIHCTPNGLFPHNPEPLPEHLGDICNLVKEKKCDIGFVTDPDGDRLAVVDNNGRFIGEEYTQAAAFDFLLGKKPGPIVTNLSSSMVNEDIAGKYGQVCHRSAVGEINVVKKMQKVGAVLGGEGNGGVINPDLHPGRDGLVGIAMILQHLAELGVTSAEYRDSLPDYTIVKRKMQLRDLDADSVLKHLLKRYGNGDTDTTDGLKIRFEDGWAHMRKSNTEPIIRLYTEAASRERAEAIADEIQNQIG
ncbi:MAG: phosphoglucosamine mutase [Balneolaceae bacterium]|nr:MAG: phosphoglucosamine mutase [Balneolaceae bacterium]